MKKLASGSALLIVGILVLVNIRGIAVPARASSGGGAVTGESGDVNGDSILDLSDAIAILLHLFGDGPPPVACAAGNEVEARVAALEGTVLDLQNALIALRAETAPASHSHPEFGTLEAAVNTIRASTRGEGARVFEPSANGQVIPFATPTPIRFDAERWDTGNFHEPDVHPERLTATTPGTYLIFATVNWEGTLSPSRRLSIRLNGSVVLAEQLTAPREDYSEVYSTTLCTVSQLSAGDHVELVAYHTVNPHTTLKSEFGMVRLPSEP